MITASIVTYHTKHNELKRVINCVMKSSVETLFIIDNSSDDRLREIVAGYDNVHYIPNKNIGYGAAHNIGIRKSIESGATYHIILNPDIFWSDNVVEELLSYMDLHPECGLIMPKVLYPNGTTQYLCKLVPSPKDLIIRRFINIKDWVEKHDYEYEMHWSGYDKIMEVPILSGCFMMLRCDVIKKTGYFDERYFVYAEDVDLCRRIGEIASTIFYPHVSIYHEYAKGSYGNKKMLRLHISSIIKYFNKWGWFFDEKRKKRNKECIEKIRADVLLHVSAAKSPKTIN